MIYTVENSDDLIQKVAFNYNRIESNLELMKKDDLTRHFGPSAEVLELQPNVDLSIFLQEKERGKTLWRLLLVLSLIFLAVEQLLIKFWRA